MKLPKLLRFYAPFVIREKDKDEKMPSLEDEVIAQSVPFAKGLNTSSS